MGHLYTEQQRMANEALFVALQGEDYISRIDTCLQKGADINAFNSEGRTPLMQAIWVESVARVRYLLGKKPDLLLKDSRGRTAFDLALTMRSGMTRSTIEKLLIEALPNQKQSARAAAAVETAASTAFPPQTGAPEVYPVAAAPAALSKPHRKVIGGFRL